MKMKLSYVILFLVCILSCQGKGNAAEQSRNPLKQLESFGFFVYDDPVDVSKLQLKTMDGNAVSLKDFQGSLVFLNFWASWCPPCRAEMPSIERLHNAMQGKNFHIVAVNAGEQQAQVSEFLKKNKYTLPVFLDERGFLTASFASRGIPTTYLVSKEGKMVAVRPGAMEYDQPSLISIFKELADD
ncbi:MAG: TlpA disulfide reductase family protein [Treponema sp.]